MMTAIAKIVDLAGGIRPLARELEKAPSTVQYWNDSGALPRGERDAIIQFLRSKNQSESAAVDLTNRAIAGLSAESEAAA